MQIGATPDGVIVKDDRGDLSVRVRIDPEDFDDLEHAIEKAKEFGDDEFEWGSGPEVK